MALGGKIDVHEAEGAGLVTSPDGALETCTGRFPSGATFEFRSGLPFVQGASAPDAIAATPEEVEQIKAALEAKFGKRRIKLEASGRFILLNAPEKSDLEKALQAAKQGLRKRMKSALGTDVNRVRENGMMSVARELFEQGMDAAAVQAELRIQYSDEEDLEDRIQVAVSEAQNPKSQKEMALAVAKRSLLPSHIADARRRGIPDDQTASGLGQFLEYYTLDDGSRIERSQGEIRDIVEAAFAEADRMERTRKVDTKALTERAYQLGMVSLAARLLPPSGTSTVEETLEVLMRDSLGEDQRKDMATLAVREAQDEQKIYWRVYKRLEADRIGNRVLAQRRSGADDATIEADLKAEYETYVSPDGRSILRGSMELTQIVAAANAMADALEDQEKVTADLVRRKKVLKANVKQFLPFTAEQKWDVSMRAKGAFRLARLRSEEGRSEEQIREEVERLFGGEDDPEAMAAYVLSRISNASFNAAQAALEVKEKAYDRAARTQVDAGQNDGQIEANLMATVKTADISTAEAKDIIRVAIEQARSAVKWEERKEQGKSLLWSASKGAVVGAGALTLAGAAATVIGTAFGLKTLWSGVKKVAPYILPVSKAVAKGTLGAALGVAKLARNTLIYAPATALWTPLKRSYEGLRAAKNYPKPPHYHMTDKWWKKPGQWVANGFRSAWWRSKQTVALAAALPLALTLGTGEGIAKGIGHHVLGTEWNGSHTVDQFMHHYEHPQPIQISGPSAAPAAAAAPAAGGDHGGHH